MLKAKSVRSRKNGWDRRRAELAFPGQAVARAQQHHFVDDGTGDRRFANHGARIEKQPSFINLRPRLHGVPAIAPLSSFSGALLWVFVGIPAVASSTTDPKLHLACCKPPLTLPILHQGPLPLHTS